MLKLSSSPSSFGRSITTTASVGGRSSSSANEGQRSVGRPRSCCRPSPQSYYELARGHVSDLTLRAISEVQRRR